MKKLQVTVVLVAALAILFSPGNRADERTGIAIGQAESAQLDRLVQDVCNKEMVLLGEDGSHGGGRTTEIKTELVQRLVARCGFGALLIESQFYDVLDFEHAVEEGNATREQLADAIGALWSRARQSAPLIDYLYQQAMAGRLRIGGIDPQVGGIMGIYSQSRLGTVLANVLAGERRDACAEAFDRHNGWKYDDTHLLDNATWDRLRGCIDDVRATLAAGGDSDVQAMATAYSRYLELAPSGDRNLRDLGLYENVRWHRARWPRGTKVIVWSATVHAVRTLDGVADGRRPMGNHLHEAYGRQLAVIGFTALSGQFGNPGASGTPNTLPEATADSLEANALASFEGGLRYLDARQLHVLGTTTARPLNYQKSHAARWADLLDGLVVLREEQAVEPIR